MRLVELGLGINGYMTCCGIRYF